MRKTIPILTPWKFKKGRGDLSSFEGEIISLPHTYNGIDGQDGGYDYYQGVTTYSYAFKDPREHKDQEVYLEFQGVNSFCEVYLNGVKLGEHKGGYSTFRFLITEVLKEENRLVVYVDNSIRKDIYPTMADFTFYGGIYRKVNLIVVEKDHFDLDFYGTKGLKADGWVDGKTGYLKVHAYTKSHKKARIFLLNQEGKLLEEKKNLETLILPEVHLWNGKEDPYLYQVIARLVSEDGTILDEVSSFVGFRTYHMDSQKGFFLNGKPYPLRGVALHQDILKRGNALTEEDFENTIKTVKELGANTLRLAHYQYSEDFLNLCDKAGLILWTEVPYISKHEAEGDENIFEQMKELVYQTYLHPSIFFRSLSNEITMKKTDKKDTLLLHQKMNQWIHENDKDRMTSMAGFTAISDFNRLIKIPDLFSFNFYFGWYAPFFFLNSLRLDFFHYLSHKDKPVGLSEYGAEGMISVHAYHPRRMDNSEEYQSLYHERLLKIISKRDYLWSTYVWNLFDFGSDGRNQAGDPGKNHKGLITFDHQTKKDAFYLYQAYWGKEPMLHLCSKRFIHRKGKKTEIKVYSNQKTIKVYLNGNFFKELSGNIVFKTKIPLKKEENLVEVSSGDLKESMTILKVKKKDPSYKAKKGNSYSWEKKH